jgi:hypothetical protein
MNETKESNQKLEGAKKIRHQILVRITVKLFFSLAAK